MCRAGPVDPMVGKGEGGRHLGSGVDGWMGGRENAKGSRESTPGEAMENGPAGALRLWAYLLSDYTRNDTL